MDQILFRTLELFLDGCGQLAKRVKSAITAYNDGDDWCKVLSSRYGIDFKKTKKRDYREYYKTCDSYVYDNQDYIGESKMDSDGKLLVKGITRVTKKDLDNKVNLLIGNLARGDFKIESLVSKPEVVNLTMSNNSVRINHTFEVIDS